jgi:CubicO group peptidase (beta-lactamase class C family)
MTLARPFGRHWFLSGIVTEAEVDRECLRRPPFPSTISFIMRRAILLVVPLLAAAFAASAIHWQRGLPSAGTGWVAKRVCSGVFVAGRDQASLFGASLPLPVPIKIPAVINQADQSVTAHIDNVFLPASPATARYRPGLGCTLEGPGDAPSPLDALGFKRPLVREEATPLPTRTMKNQSLEQALDRAFARSAEEAERGLGTRAVVVLHHGSVVTERYAKGFSATTPLPGWSMAKSVTNAMVGLLSDAGRLNIMAPVGLDEWSNPGDPRAAITWDQLLRMSSGLTFSENYTLPSSDAIQMLFGLDRFSKGRYAALRPLEFEPDTNWSYSSGTTNLLQYALLERAFDGDLPSYLAFPHKALFGPIGMASAVLETDARGVFVGSSFLYATARDWARFGLLYLEDGEWAGEQILSRKWIEYSGTPTPTEESGTYGAHWWLNADPATGTRRMSSLDPNILIASGFEGQSVVVVPDHDLVVVRLGLDRGNRLDIEDLTARIIAALSDIDRT